VTYNFKEPTDCSHPIHMYLDIEVTQRNPYPLTEEIRLKIFGSPDLSVFLKDLLSDGDSLYPRDNLFEVLGTPVETCLICMGTLMNVFCKFWQSSLFEV